MMTFKKALRIKELRLGPIVYTYRSVAEVIEKEFPEYPELSGDQMHGMDLIAEAMEFLHNKPLNEIEKNIRNQWDR